MTVKRFTASRLMKSLGVVAMAAVALTACRAEEQGRMINYEPGVYKGKPDTKLTAERLDQLRARTISQGGATGTGISGGGGGSAKGSDVRAPGGLGARTQYQGGSK